MDVASMLRSALIHQGVKLDPPLEEQAINEQQGGFYDPTVSYISDLLMEEDEDDHHCLHLSHSDKFHQILGEFSSIVAKNSIRSSSAATAAADDLKSLLLHCARDVAAGNTQQAFALLRQINSSLSIRQGSSIEDTEKSCLDRTIYFFANALAARLGGVGAQAYAAMAKEVNPRQHLSVRALNLPCSKISQRFANESILALMDGFHKDRTGDGMIRTVNGGKRRPLHRLHIVDYGIQHGFQWPYLILALAQRYSSGGNKGGIELKITGVDYPSVVKLEETGKKLVEFATTCGVSLEFMAVATDSWEKERIIRCENEVLVVNCVLRLRHLREQGIVAVDKPRDVFFERVYSLKPDLFVMADICAEMSSPLFLPRFKESFEFYTNKMEYFAAMAGERPEERGYMERVAARAIMNIVACEGLDRVERANSYRVWDGRARRAGLEGVDVSDEIYAKVRKAAGQFRSWSRFGSTREGNWILLGWKETPLYGMSAWRPKPVIQPPGLFQALKR